MFHGAKAASIVRFQANHVGKQTHFSLLGVLGEPKLALAERRQQVIGSLREPEVRVSVIHEHGCVAVLLPREVLSRHPVITLIAMS